MLPALAGPLGVRCLHWLGECGLCGSRAGRPSGLRFEESGTPLRRAPD